MSRVCVSDGRVTAELPWAAHEPLSLPCALAPCHCSAASAPVRLPPTCVPVLSFLWVLVTPSLPSLPSRPWGMPGPPSASPTAGSLTPPGCGPWGPVVREPRRRLSSWALGCRGPFYWGRQRFGPGAQRVAGPQLQLHALCSIDQAGRGPRHHGRPRALHWHGRLRSGCHVISVS